MARGFRILKGDFDYLWDFHFSNLEHKERMKINLKKAVSIQGDIDKLMTDLFTEIRNKRLLTIELFEDPVVLVEKNRNDVQILIKRFLDLTEIRSDIRAKVARENANCGIGDMLAAVNALERKDRLFSYLSTDCILVKDVEVIKKTLNRLELAEGTTIRRSSVDTGIFNDEEIQKSKQNALKAQKDIRQLKDTMLETNIRNTIELGAEAQAILERESIV